MMRKVSEKSESQFSRSHGLPDRSAPSLVIAREEAEGRLEEPFAATLEAWQELVNERSAGRHSRKGIEHDLVSGNRAVVGRHVPWCTGVFRVGVVCDGGGWKVNNAVYQSRVNGLSAIAKKVFSVVPIAEAWPPHQISGELARSTGSAADYRIVAGRLNTLINLGLVTEPKPNTFRRVATKEEKQEPQKKLTDMIKGNQVAIQKQQKQVSAIERLASIAQSLKSVAAEIETAAIEIDEQLKTDKQDTEKLKQLQSLLRSLG